MLSNRMSQLKPYVPGEQPKYRDYIKLNANENPYSPPENVIQAVKNMLDVTKGETLKLYPDPDSMELKNAYAELLNKTGGVLSNPKPLSYKLKAENIFAGNGSDEVLSFVFYAFFNEDSPVVIPEHTYSFYPVYAGYYNIPLKKLPLNTDFSINIETMKKEFASCSGIIFANPNAPTGIALSNNELRSMLKKYPKDKVFVVDEAYADFSDESALPLLEEFPNLLIIRTSSKSLSFAGMRLGFACGSKVLIDALTTVKNSFNHFPVDRITQTAGIAACKETDYYSKTAKEVVRVRDNFITFLKKRGWEVIGSKTNFILAGCKEKTGKEIYEYIKSKGILVRYFSIPVIENYVRITIGSEEQMKQLQRIMEEIK